MYSIISSARKYILAGVLIIMPIWVTWLIFAFLLELLTSLGGPLVNWFSTRIRPYAPSLSEWLVNPWFQSVVAVTLILAAFYVLGWLATKIIGRRLIALFDALMDRIPLVHTIYGSVKTFLAALQQKPDGVQRVVLIDFPSPEMKTVGFVTRTLVDDDTGRELAAVYVPTTPNPTSGYLEIVPLDKVTSTNWTMDEAMTFIISGGAVAPESMNFDKGVGGLNEPST
jgi:uncharacterized membrane protein